jgi:hypothetical protein
MVRVEYKDESITFPRVWYVKELPPSRRIFPSWWSIDAAGTLLMTEDALHFQARVTRITIPCSDIVSVDLVRNGRSPYNEWMCISYGVNAQAYFMHWGRMRQYMAIDTRHMVRIITGALGRLRKGLPLYDDPHD